MTKDANKSAFDIFIAQSTYPEAASIFTVRYKSLDEVKNDCYIVLDTNALLSPYNVSKGSLEQIRRTYETLINQERLIIPGQVAREFAKNRATKLVEIYQQLSSKRNDVKDLQSGKYPLLTSIAEYENLLKIETEVNKLHSQYREQYQDGINKMLEKIRSWIWNDPVSLLYGELFTAKVVLDSPVDKESTEIDLARRQLHKIPPGYKDASKDDKGVGDLLIWQTILEVGRTKKKSVIFISGEEKPDWWYSAIKNSYIPDMN